MLTYGLVYAAAKMKIERERKDPPPPKSVKIIMVMNQLPAAVKAWGRKRVTMAFARSVSLRDPAHGTCPCPAGGKARVSTTGPSSTTPYFGTCCTG